MADDEQPGWDAIDHALEHVYGARQPLRYDTVVKYGLGGPDPLDGLAAYRNDEPPHWHFVGYGLSEIYDKESDDPTTSGFGFELTFRLARAADEIHPPHWALNFLQNLARYVCDSGSRFEPLHYVDLGGPITPSRPTAICAAILVADPALPRLETVHGQLRFLQLVGVTGDELARARSGQAAAVIAARQARDPLLVTDVA